MVFTLSNMGNVQGPAENSVFGGNMFSEFNYSYYFCGGRLVFVLWTE